MSNVIWVDGGNNVLGKISREKAHKEGILHRVAVIYLINDKGEILVNERAKDGHLDHSSAGHVDVGESYVEAAKRELREELGVIGVKLQDFGATSARDVGMTFGGEYFDSRHMFKVFICHAWPVKLKKDEVKRVFWADPMGVLKDMHLHPEKYTEGFKKTLQLYVLKKHRLLKDAANKAHRRDIVKKGNLTPKEWETILKSQGWKCKYCKKPFTDQRPPTIDHIIPLKFYPKRLFLGHDEQRILRFLEKNRRPASLAAIARVLKSSGTSWSFLARLDHLKRKRFIITKGPDPDPLS